MASIGGFFKGLGKGLLGAGGAIAAPFTGGASLATVLPAILGSAGAVASGIAGGRGTGRIAEGELQQRQDQIGQQSERQRMRRLVAADLFGGGAINPETLASLRTAGPSMTPLPQSGKMDTFLNTLGAVGQFGGALGGAVNQPRQPQAPVATMDQFQQRPFFQPQKPRNPFEGLFQPQQGQR